MKQLEEARVVRASPDLGPFAAQAATWEDDVHTVGVSLGQLVMCQVWSSLSSLASAPRHSTSSTPEAAPGAQPALFLGCRLGKVHP